MLLIAARLDAAIEAAAPILNEIYKTMESAEAIAQYFEIVDLFQYVSLHRVDQPVKQLILFHSLHASIYYAVWHGLFDTLEVLSQKL